MAVPIQDLGYCGGAEEKKPSIPNSKVGRDGVRPCDHLYTAGIPGQSRRGPVVHADPTPCILENSVHFNQKFGVFGRIS